MVETGGNISAVVFPDSSSLARFRKVVEETNRFPYAEFALQILPGIRRETPHGHVLDLSDTHATVIYHATNPEIKEQLDNAAREILTSTAQTETIKPAA